MPKGSGSGEECGGAGGGGVERVEVAELLHLTIMFLVCKSFIERPKGSNSMEQLLSVVKRRIEIRFLIMLGDTKTSLRIRL